MNFRKIFEDLCDSFEEITLVSSIFFTPENCEKIAKVAMVMGDCLAQGGQIISCGNGGSMCDAMHFAEELTGRFRLNRRPLNAVAISNPGHLSCTANDFGYEEVFSRAIEAWGKKGGVLLAISTSGNSPNIIRAAQEAKRKKMHVVGLTGKDGGKLASLCDSEIRVKYDGFADRIQEVHIKVIHLLVQGIEKYLKL